MRQPVRLHGLVNKMQLKMYILTFHSHIFCYQSAHSKGSLAHAEAPSAHSEAPFAPSDALIGHSEA